MKKDPMVYLGHVYDGTVVIAEYVHGLTKPKFLKDHKTQDAVIRRLEIIGEATKHLTEETRQKDRTIPWKQICGLRDILIHDYAFVDMDVVWKVVRQDIPKLRKSIAALVIAHDEKPSSKR